MKALHVLRVAAAAHDHALALADAVDAPALDAASDRLLLRVLAAALNPGDVKFLTGAMPLPRRDALPYSPGLEVCGVVEAVGAKVAAAGTFRIGDRVVAALRPMQLTGGGLAEYVVVEAALAAVVPPSVSAEEAVTLPLAGALALHAVKETGIGKDARVLVLGASSAVGRLVVQLAKNAGAAFVAGTAPRKDLLAKLPLDLAIDGSVRWYDELKGKELDVVLDCVGEREGWRNADKVLAPSSRSIFAVLLGDIVSDGDVRATTDLITIGFLSMWKSFWRVGPKLKVVGQFPTTASLQQVLSLVETKQLVPALDSSSPLPLSVDALQRAVSLLKTQQNTGKLVFQVGTP